MQGFQLAFNQVIGGTGTVKGNLVVGSPSKISAGTWVALNTGASNSVGGAKANTGTTVFDSGGTYAWKIADNAAGAGSGWDELNVTHLSVTAGTGSNQFTISLSGLNAGSVGSPANVTNGGRYEWVIAQSVAPIKINGNTVADGTIHTGSSSDIFKLDTNTSKFSLSDGSFDSSKLTLEMIGGGHELALAYDASPEPGSAMLCAAGAMTMLLGRQRGGKRKSEG